MMRVKYKLNLTLEIDRVENWDEACPIGQALKQATDSIRDWTFLLRRAGIEDLVLKPKIELEYFQLSPEENS